MDTSRDKPAGTDGNPYIWLRYTTQFSTGGRTHTIEMGIPVPVGASAEMREQLIREAEMGMEQLARRVESRVSQMLQRSSRPPETARAQESATLRPPQAPLQDVGSRSIPGIPAATAMRPPAPAREAPQPLSLPEKQPAATPVRQGGVVNMPVTPGVQGDANSMKLSQFMQIIRENWGLTPKQAMDLLNVKTLNGINYREALRQLQPLVEGDARSVSTPEASKNSPVVSQPKPAEDRGRALAPIHLANAAGAAEHRQLANDASASTASRSGQLQGVPAAPSGEMQGEGPPSNPAQREGRGRPQGSPPNAAPPPPLRNEVKQGALAGPANIPVIPIKDDMIREVPRKVYKFDEEDEEMDEEKEEGSEEQQAIARIKLDELKEVRGTALASPGRLTALQNVLNSQISDEQLQRLIQNAWGATSVKKLKVDQVEALISWAKEDYFVDEVEDVLALIDEEGHFARSDW